MGLYTRNRDNYIYPTEGYKSTLGYEYAGLGGDFSYHKFTIDGSTFEGYKAVTSPYSYTPTSSAAAEIVG